MVHNSIYFGFLIGFFFIFFGCMAFEKLPELTGIIFYRIFS